MPAGGKRVAKGQCSIHISLHSNKFTRNVQIYWLFSHAMGGGVVSFRTGHVIGFWKEGSKTVCGLAKSTLAKIPRYINSCFNEHIKDDSPMRDLECMLTKPVARHQYGNVDGHFSCNAHMLAVLIHCTYVCKITKHSACQ